jgi:hypothetical protein
MAIFSLSSLRWHLVLLRLTSHFTLTELFAKEMVASGVAQRFDLFILTCLRTVFRHNRQTSMPPVGFEPTISAGERPKTYALERVATGIGKIRTHDRNRRAAEDLRLRPRGYWDRHFDAIVKSV